MREQRGVTLHMATDIEPLIGPPQYMLQSHIAVKKIKQVRLVKGQNFYTVTCTVYVSIRILQMLILMNL